MIHCIAVHLASSFHTVGITLAAVVPQPRRVRNQGSRRHEARVDGPIGSID
jgi:hypothetical protein